MSLIEREYMSDRYRQEKKKIEPDEYKKNDKNINKLWKLYAKKHKNFIDRWKIKRLEKSIHDYMNNN